MSKTVREVPMKFFSNFETAKQNIDFTMRQVEIEDNITPNSLEIPSPYNPAVSILYRLKPFLRDGLQGKYVELVYIQMS